MTKGRSEPGETGETEHGTMFLGKNKNRDLFCRFVTRLQLQRPNRRVDLQLKIKKLALIGQTRM